MRNGLLKSFADSKRVKYGTVNAIFIAIIIAIVVMVNSIISILSSVFTWQIDMTKEQLYTVSDELVLQIDEACKKIDVDIIFCCDKDEAQKSYTDLENGNALAYVHATATQLAEKIDNINILYHDPIKEYKFFKDNFTTVGSSIKPSESTVIIARRSEDGTYGTLYRICHVQSFYTFAQVSDTNQLYSYSGELVFASAIIGLTYDVTPTVYFTSGHGEDLPTVKSGKQYVPQLVNLFLSSGFQIRPLDLSEKQFECTCGQTYGKSEVNLAIKEFACADCGQEYRTDSMKFEKDREVPKDAGMIVINQPSSDYTDYELRKISKYMVAQKGSVMCFTEYDEELPVLYDFIKNEAGVSVNSGDRVQDKDSTSIGDVVDFRGNVAVNDATNSYLSTLNNAGSARPIFNNSAVLEINPAYTTTKEDGTKGEFAREATRYTQPLLISDKDALYKNQSGAHNLMTITSIETIKNNQTVYSYLIVCPSGGFVEDAYLSADAYPNKDIIYSLIHSTTASKAQTPVNIESKKFENYDLDITSSQATAVMLCMIIIPPVIVSAIGVFVIVRRKRR